MLDKLGINIFLHVSRDLINIFEEVKKNQHHYGLELLIKIIPCSTSGLWRHFRCPAVCLSELYSRTAIHQKIQYLVTTLHVVS